MMLSKQEISRLEEIEKIWEDFREKRRIKEKEIFDKYPLVFQKEKEYYERILGVGYGWMNLLDDLCSKINNELTEDSDFKISQVKEKFGGLRFYTYDSTPKIEEFIDKAEEDSYKICETCGKPGSIHRCSWIQTSCDSCYDIYMEYKSLEIKKYKRHPNSPDR